MSRGVACVQNGQVVRDPFGSRKQAYGMRIFSHVRGNPDTEAIRNLKAGFMRVGPSNGKKDGRRQSGSQIYP